MDNSDDTTDYFTPCACTQVVMSITMDFINNYYIETSLSSAWSGDPSTLNSHIQALLTVASGVLALIALNTSQQISKKINTLIAIFNVATGVMMYLDIHV